MRPSTNHTHHPNWHLHPLSRFAAIHFLDGQTDRSIDQPTDSPGEKSVPIPAYALLTIAMWLIISE